MEIQKDIKESYNTDLIASRITDQLFTSSVKEKSNKKFDGVMTFYSVPDSSGNQYIKAKLTFNSSDDSAKDGIQEVAIKDTIHLNAKSNISTEDNSTITEDIKKDSRIIKTGTIIVCFFILLFLIVFKVKDK